MSAKSSWRICPKCKSYNTVHVARCYKCAFTFPVSLKPAAALPAAAEGDRGPSGESRSSKRKVLGVFGAVLEVNGEVRHDAYIENISDTGVLLYSNFNYKKHDRFYMLIPIENNNYVVEGIVRRSEKLGFSLWLFRVGVEFTNPAKEFTEHVSRITRCAYTSDPLPGF